MYNKNVGLVYTLFWLSKLAHKVCVWMFNYFYTCLINDKQNKTTNKKSALVVVASRLRLKSFASCGDKEKLRYKVGKFWMNLCIGLVHISNATGKKNRKKKQELREIQLFLFSQAWGRRKRSFSMVQSLEIRFAFCVRLTNNDNFLADKRADGGKVLKDNVWEKKKSNGIIKRKTRTSWSLVCCVFWGHSGPLAWKLQERKGNE